MMNLQSQQFELKIGIGDTDDSAALASQVHAIVVRACDESQHDLIVEEPWQPRPVRDPFTRAFFVLVGAATLTRSSLQGVAGVLNEVAVAFEGTSEAELLTLEVGDEVVALADVTREMIESWLPADAAAT